MLHHRAWAYFEDFWYLLITAPKGLLAQGTISQAVCNNDVCFLTPTLALRVKSWGRVPESAFYHLSICFALSLSKSKCGLSVGGREGPDKRL